MHKQLLNIFALLVIFVAYKIHKGKKCLNIKVIYKVNFYTVSPGQIGTGKQANLTDEPALNCTMLKQYFPQTFPQVVSN